MQPSKPDYLSSEHWSHYLKEKAQATIRIELRDYDWMTLDLELARKIHAILPGPSPEEMHEYHANRRRLAGLAIKHSEHRLR